MDYNGRQVANFQICVRAKLLVRTKKAKLLQSSSEESDFLAVAVKLSHLSELEFRREIFFSCHLQWFRVIGFFYGKFLGCFAKKAEFEVSNLSLRLS